MKTSRFPESQVALALWQVDKGLAGGKICRKLGISEQTYYRWRRKYGGLIPLRYRETQQ